MKSFLQICKDIERCENEGDREQREYLIGLAEGRDEAYIHMLSIEKKYHLKRIKYIDKKIEQLEE